jgi:hypothetical protein
MPRITPDKYPFHLQIVETIVKPADEVTAEVIVVIASSEYDLFHEILELVYRIQKYRGAMCGARHEGMHRAMTLPQLQQYTAIGRSLREIETHHVVSHLRDGDKIDRDVMRRALLKFSWRE